MAKTETNKIKITLVKSGIAQPGKHKAVLAGLGLRKMNKSVIRPDTPQIRGMIEKVIHLVQVDTA